MYGRTGVYVKAGLEKAKAATLAVIGAVTDSHKTVLAVDDCARGGRLSLHTHLLTEPRMKYICMDMICCSNLRLLGLRKYIF